MQITINGMRLTIEEVSSNGEMERADTSTLDVMELQKVIDKATLAVDLEERLETLENMYGIALDEIEFFIDDVLTSTLKKKAKLGRFVELGEYINSFMIRDKNGDYSQFDQCEV